MQPNDALNDLKAIRQIMERARKASDGFGGWFMVLWGAIWLIGFSGTHFLIQNHQEALIPWLWLPLNAGGFIASFYLGIQMSRRTQVRSSLLWKSILFWWLALGGFDLLLIWLLPVRGEQIPLLIILTFALGYFQFGLFIHWSISAVGVFISLTAAAAALLFPDWLNLAIAVLGGGALIGTGLLAVRYGAEG